MKIFETFSHLSISMPFIIDFKHYEHNSHNLLKHLRGSNNRGSGFDKLYRINANTPRPN